MISDNMELVMESESNTIEIMDNNKTIKAFEKLAKTMKITKISDLHPLISSAKYNNFLNY